MRFKLPKILTANTEWLETKQNTILSAAAIITVFNVISAASGFFKQRFFISSFYDTAISSHEALDALLVASQIPETMFTLIIFGAVSAAFIPVFIEQRKENEAEAFRITAAVMTLLLCIFAAVSIIVFIFAEPITAWRTGEAFTDEQVHIAAQLTRIMLAAQFFFAISSFLSALLQSYQRFLMPAIAPVLYNLGIILGVWLFADQFGIYSAGIGVVLGAFLHMAIQFPSVRKVGFHFKPSFKWRLPGVKRILGLMPARVLSISVGELRSLSLGFFTTSIGDSSMLIMQLGTSLMTAPIRFFGVPISQAALPFFSDEVAKNDKNKLKELIVQSVNQISFLIIPASVLMLILRLPIVRLLFGTGNFPWQVTLTTGWVVAILALSIAVQAVVQLLVRAFYALKDTKTPFVVAALDLLLYLGICFVTTFVLGWGVLGIAFATSITAIIEFLAILYALDRKMACFRDKEFWMAQIKIFIAGFLMAVFLYLPFRILDEVIFDTSRTIELIALTLTTSTIGLMVYLFFAALFEIKELQFFATLITKFGPWKKILSQNPEAIMEPAPDGDTGL
ncbi:MAG: murein biosynthesis integral membrane protein MurJ [bacterium]|nr:murein biosynthesis integral membrane protein MurJ [bacterium]